MTGKRNTSKKVMILYASYGDGHVQVARALREKFNEYGVQDVIMIDLFKQASPTVNAITRYFYIKSYKVLPAVYGWLYYSTKHIRWDSFFAKWLQSYGVHTLLDVIRDERPDVVIHTFPMSVVPLIRKKTGRYIPSVTVVTDFDLHRRWIHPAIDRFYVATDDLKQKIIKAGIPSDHIQVSGIPVKPAFEQQISVDGIYHKYGLNTTDNTLLIMAGSYGVMQGLTDMCRRLSKLPNIQIVVVCGKNQVLQDELSAKFNALSNVRILGFVEQIHELMRISSCMVTKPGGITLSEAIMMELPILIYRPVPGQEKDNALYLAGKGAAWISHDSEQLEAQIRTLLQDEQQLESMRRALQSLRQPQSAERIVLDIMTNFVSEQRQLAVHKV